MSTDAPTQIRTRLSGRTLFLARLTWVVLAALTAIVYSVSIPAGYEYLSGLSPDNALRQLGLSASGIATYLAALYLLLDLGFFTAAAVIFWRRSDDWMALLLSLAFVTTPSWTVANVTIATNQTSGAWLVWFLASFDVGSAFIAFYLFPDGRFVPRWTRWLALGVGVWALSVFFLFPTAFSPSEGRPFSIIFVPGLLIGMGAGVFAQIYRYVRAATATQRQQTKWWMFGLTTAFLAQMSQTLPPLIFPVLRQPGLPSVLFALLDTPVVIFSFLLMPLSLGFSILRYRLWDIDFVINRSLVYGVLTALLIALFGGSLFVVSQLFQNFAGGPLVAVAASATIFGTIFQPARRGLQRFVDRRFYNIQIEYQATPPAKPAPLPTGETFTKTHFSTYIGLELIGRGGMSEVYKARHPTLNRTVAIKILPAQLAAEADFRKRFQREAQTVAALKHPNIVEVFDFDEADGTMYMVMEYIAGKDVDHYLRETGRLTLAQALPILKDIAAALDYAHAQGLVHRDIKPSNVMLDPVKKERATARDEAPSLPSSFRAVLTDFGIAKILTGGTRFTATGGYVGHVSLHGPGADSSDCKYRWPRRRVFVWDYGLSNAHGRSTVQASQPWRSAHRPHDPARPRPARTCAGLAPCCGVRPAARVSQKPRRTLPHGRGIFRGVRMNTRPFDGSRLTEQVGS